jgi:hypothetical protein
METIREVDMWRHAGGPILKAQQVFVFVYDLYAPHADIGQRRSGGASVVLPRVESLQANKMAAMIENCSKLEAHAVVRIVQVGGVNSEIHHRLVSV